MASLPLNSRCSLRLDMRPRRLGTGEHRHPGPESRRSFGRRRTRPLARLRRALLCGELAFVFFVDEVVSLAALLERRPGGELREGDLCHRVLAHLGLVDDLALVD